MFFGRETGGNGAGTDSRDRLDGSVRRREDGESGSRVARDRSLHFLPPYERALAQTPAALLDVDIGPMI